MRMTKRQRELHFFTTCYLIVDVNTLKRGLDESHETLTILLCTVRITVPSSCKQGHFECWESKVCIPHHQLCDNYSHCDDNSDEMNCGQYISCFPLSFLPIKCDYLLQFQLMQ